MNKLRTHSLENLLEDAALGFFGEMFVQSVRDRVKHRPEIKEPLIEALELLIQELKQKP